MATLFAILWCIAAADSGPGAGTIEGVVVNGTRGQEPMGNVDVLLRAGSEGGLIVVAETTTDQHGRFVFSDVPLDSSVVYLPGVNHGGVHYPGPRLRLDRYRQIANATIVAFEAIEKPSPLEALRHDIDVEVQQRGLAITETLLVANRTRSTYVGRPTADEPAVTLRLSIPESFDRVTFRDEFHGRRFEVADRQPVTRIPWPPGERELKFSYRVPLGDGDRLFRRPLDMPAAIVRIRVSGEKETQASCNLPSVGGTGDGVAFTSAGQELSADFAIELRLGPAPVPWMKYARWGSIALLAGLVLTAMLQSRLTKGQADPPHELEETNSRQISAPDRRQQRRQARRKNRRRAG